MEEEGNYSSLVFKNSTATQKEEKEDQTIYSEVKSNKPATAEQKADEEQVIYSPVKPKAAVVAVQKDELTAHSVENPDESADSDQKGGELICSSEVKLEASGTSAPKAETSANGQTPLLSVCLGTLCVLLVMAVIALSVTISMVMKGQEETISDLTVKNGQLSVDNNNLTNQTKQLMEDNINLQNMNQELKDNNTALNSIILMLNNENDQLQNNNTVLKNQTEMLRKERNNLNWTLGVILTFDTFPVKVFCPNKTCQPCLAGWIQFQDKCYFFYNESSWKTWSDSRQFCQNNFADLVVINNLQEQQFVGNLTKSYYDEWHGFWLGLRNVTNSWVWVDGHNDTLGFWASVNFNESYVLLVPGAPPTQSWRRVGGGSTEKFICEREALIWST